MQSNDKHYIKWLEIHDGVNLWEKPAATDTKLELRLCLQENQRLCATCPCNLCHTSLGKSWVTGDKKGAK